MRRAAGLVTMRPFGPRRAFPTSSVSRLPGRFRYEGRSPRDPGPIDGRFAPLVHSSSSDAGAQYALTDAWDWSPGTACWEAAETPASVLQRDQSWVAGCRLAAPTGVVRAVRCRRRGCRSVCARKPRVGWRSRTRGRGSRRGRAGSSPTRRRRPLDRLPRYCEARAERLLRRV